MIKLEFDKIKLFVWIKAVLNYGTMVDVVS